jgi:hypothetical protein
LAGQADAGFADCVGVTPYFGVAAYIELKAPGRRSTLKPHQRDFLLGKISMGAFAVCIDSVELLSETYNEWLALRTEKYFDGAKQYLIGRLPKIKENTDNLADITG